MVMALKLPIMQIFMTKKDEFDFSLMIKEKLPHVVFVDCVFKEKEFDYRNGLDECTSVKRAIWDQSILSIPQHQAYISERGQMYHAPGVGPGLIQYVPTKGVNYDVKIAGSGSITSSYDSELEPAMDVFVKTVWKIFKSKAKKLYYMNRLTGEVSERPETRFFAWPDAVKTYNGDDGFYLLANRDGYFVAKE